jgi:hypothetical protein
MVRDVLSFPAMHGLVFVIVAGCTSGSSVSEMSAFAQVTSRDTRVDVTLQLLDDGLYQLASDDRLGATFRGQGIELVTQDFIGQYGGSFPLDSDVLAGETVTIVVNLGGEKVLLPASAPADFVIAAPATAPAAQPVTVTWLPTATDPMGWRGSTICTGATYSDGPIPHDVGRIDFPPGVLAPATPSRSCTTPLEIDRTGYSSPSTALHQADVYFTRTHTTQIELTP